MNAVSALARLLELGVPYFTTSDAGAALDLDRSAASHALARLARAGRLVRIKPGTWAIPDRLDRLALVEALCDPSPAYVSLQTALYLHGMISQIPAVLYGVGLCRAKRYRTPLGDVSLHRIAPAFFFGFERRGTDGPLIATPEKALLDVFYLAPAKSGLFRVLPELELPKGFRRGTARRWAGRIPSRRTRSLVLKRLESALG